MNREVMHVNFCLFSAIFAVPRIVEIQKFCYHGTLALPLLLSVVLILAPPEPLVSFEHVINKTSSPSFHYLYCNTVYISNQ